MNTGLENVEREMEQPREPSNKFHHSCVASGD